MNEQIDWYAPRDELAPQQIFRTHSGDVVKLDRSVPGDGSKWYVATWWGSSFAHMDDTIEPGDLAVRLADDWQDEGPDPMRSVEFPFAENH